MTSSDSFLSAASTIARSEPQGTTMIFLSCSMCVSSRQHFNSVGSLRSPAIWRVHIRSSSSRGVLDVGPENTLVRRDHPIHQSDREPGKPMDVRFLPGQELQSAPILSEWAGDPRSSTLALPARTILVVLEGQPLLLAPPEGWGGG